MLIENVIDFVLTKTSPRHDEQLRGFVADVDDYLSDHELFSDVEVDTRKDDRCVVEARTVIAESVLTLQDVSDKLAEVWEEINYNHFHAAACNWYHDRTELRFVTVPLSEQYCITGRIIVTAPHHDRLVENFQKNYAIPGVSKYILD